MLTFMVRRSESRRGLTATAHAQLATCLIACAITLLAVAAIAAPATIAASAHAARTLNLSESAQLHRTSSSGVHLNEQGTASGTIRGSIYIHLRVSANRVGAEVSIYPHGGSLTATGSASYHVVGGSAPFSGTVTIIRGSGTYAHAHSGTLRFSGSIRRSDDAVSVRLSGPLNY